MNYLFTICGRAGSKGLKSKNISDFDGIPLVYYTVGVMSKVIDELKDEGHNASVVLSTDSNELADSISRQKVLDILFLPRSEELSGDRVAKVTVIKDALIRAEESFNCKFDYLIDLDITSPLRTVKDVLSAIRKKEERKDTDYVYSLSPARKNPYFNMAKETNGLYEKVIHANYISRQETPLVYDMNASIYVYEINALINKEPTGFFNDGADAIIMRDTGILDIDCQEDKEMMEVLARYYFFQKDEEFKEIKKLAHKVNISSWRPAMKDH